jgi:hypothetical protein
MNRIEEHRINLLWAFDLLDQVVADVTPEMADWMPPGTANPLGATYAHALCSADAMVNGLLAGGTPLYESVWEGQTGISEPQMALTDEWALRVLVDVSKARPYAQALAESIEAYLDSLEEDDLDHTIALPNFDMGERTVSWILSGLVAGHLHNMTGEIAVLKGLQGGRGYPF